MAVRLLRQKVPFEDLQIEDLKATMFQLVDGLWFSGDMISDFETRVAFQDWATGLVDGTWLFFGRTGS